MSYRKSLDVDGEGLCDESVYQGKLSGYLSATARKLLTNAVPTTKKITTTRLSRVIGFPAWLTSQLGGRSKGSGNFRPRRNQSGTGLLSRRPTKVCLWGRHVFRDLEGAEGHRLRVH